MRQQKELDNSGASRASILMKVGACVGGTIIGYLSQWIGRRRAMVVASLISACLIPAWIMPNGEADLSASGFFMQFFVQGAWGVIPIHLNELSPPAYRSSFPGRFPPFTRFSPLTAFLLPFPFPHPTPFPPFLTLSLFPFPSTKNCIP